MVESIPAVYGHGPWYNLESSPYNYYLCQSDVLTWTSTTSLDSPVNLACMFLGYGRKLVQGTLHTERPRVTKRFKWLSSSREATVLTTALHHPMWPRFVVKSNHVLKTLNCPLQLLSVLVDLWWVFCTCLRQFFYIHLTYCYILLGFFFFQGVAHMQ